MGWFDEQSAAAACSGGEKLFCEESFKLGKPEILMVF
jgi:hypothetical protein